MNKSPQISVIVPVYNLEKYLPQCIESILFQTLDDFELILVDDGSLDHSGDICKEYAAKDNRVKVFRQKNLGVSTARNKGLEKARGKYIVFVDADDYVRPNYLQDLFEALPPGENEALVIESVTKLYPDSKKIVCSLPNLELSAKSIYKLLTELSDKNIGYSAAKLYNKNIIDRNKIAFIPTVSLLEDYFFLLDYALNAETVIVRNISNYIYRVGYSEQTQSVSFKRFEQEYLIFQNYYKRIQEYQRLYHLKENDMKKVRASLAVFFHRTILSLYKTKWSYTYKERISAFQQIIASYNDWIKVCFTPAYIVDRVGKKMLINGMYTLFDIWMRALLKIHFTKMFGVQAEKAKKI